MISLPLPPHVSAQILAGIVLRGLGGPGSGNFGHAGRPGEKGGSASAEGPSLDPKSIQLGRVERIGHAIGVEKSEAKLRAVYDEVQKDVDHDAFKPVIGGNSHYQAIAHHLRTGEPVLASGIFEYGEGLEVGHQKSKVFIDSVVARLDQAFEHPSAKAVDTTLAYRGLVLQEPLEVGQELTDKFYSAFSTSSNHAATFTKSHGSSKAKRYLLEVVLEKGQKMIAPTYGHNPEAQVWLPRGSKMRVKSISKLGTDKIRVVRVEIVK